MQVVKQQNEWCRDPQTEKCLTSNCKCKCEFMGRFLEYNRLAPFQKGNCFNSNQNILKQFKGNNEHNAITINSIWEELEWNTDIKGYLGDRILVCVLYFGTFFFSTLHFCR